MSSDASWEIAQSAKRDHDILIKGPDDGIYDAINKGILAAEGDIIAILNSDDYYLHNDVLSELARCFEDEVDIVYAGTRYYTSDLDEYVDYIPCLFPGSGAFKDGWHPPHPSFFTRKKCYVDGGLYDTAFKVAADFDLMFRFFEVNELKSRLYPVSLVGMSSGGYSSKLSSVIRGMYEIRSSFLKNNQIPGTFYFSKRYLKKYFERKFNSVTSRK
jgi:glycosyltransferase